MISAKEIADAVKTVIQGHTFTKTLTVTSSIYPSLREEDLTTTGYLVSVLPRAYPAISPATRGVYHVDTDINVVLAKLVPDGINSSEVDTLLGLIDEILVFLAGKDITVSGYVISNTNVQLDPIYDRDKLQNNVFLSAINLTYKTSFTRS